MTTKETVSYTKNISIDNDYHLGQTIIAIQGGEYLTALLVGADSLGNIPKVLKDYGYHNLIHWTGRKNSTRNKPIPLNVDLVLVFHDYVNHKLMESIKNQAKQRSLSIVFSKRGISQLKESLK